MRCIILLFAVSCYSETATLNELNEAIDLTWQFDNDTVYWTHPISFSFSKRIAEVRVDGVWGESYDFCAGEHGGTYLNAPSHFNKRGWQVGEIPLTRLIARGIMIDLTDEVQKLHGRARLLPKHLEKWIDRHGDVPENCVVLIRFGWSKYYLNKRLYLGIDAEYNLNFPGISHTAAEWIVESGNVVGVGIDTASVDPGGEPNFPAQRILNSNQIYVLENINIPPKFPENGFMLLVMPMKVAKANGAPLRIVAVPFTVGIIPSDLIVSATPLYGHIIVIISSTILYILYLPLFVD